MSDLSYFTIMAKNSRGKATAQLVNEALSAPNVFVYGELLAIPTVQQLSEDAETKPVHDLLSIFTYGTYLDYKEKRDTLPELTPAQLDKLRQLTIVSKASKSRNLTYDDLAESLDISDVRVLEDTVIDAITNNLLQAKLDQAARNVEVADVIGRDVLPADIDAMIDTLTKWHDASSKVITELDSLANEGRRADAERQKRENELQGMIEAQKNSVRKELMESSDGSKFDIDMDDELKRKKKGSK
eukprot:TRINITY_DN10860_c0_g1_i1.p1 TRINITY_DN10860_c0_g1~~TRINITY_DN10860_c0_g1_i1.p1  ORF type:complete len:243 (+),score=60.17 TRINITY_DN10860_c0_g1_i1:47-775(+)